MSILQGTEAVGSGSSWPRQPAGARPPHLVVLPSGNMGVPAHLQARQNWGAMQPGIPRSRHTNLPAQPEFPWSTELPVQVPVSPSSVPPSCHQRPRTLCLQPPGALLLSRSCLPPTLHDTCLWLLSPVRERGPQRGAMIPRWNQHAKFQTL